MVHTLSCSCWEVKLKYVPGEEKLFVPHSSLQGRTFILDAVWLPWIYFAWKQGLCFFWWFPVILDLSALQFLFLYNSLSDFYSINAFLFNISCNEGNVKVEKIQETLRMLKWIVKISFLALSWQCLFTESLVGWMPYEVASQPVFLCPNAVVRMSFVVFVFPCLFHPFCLTNVGSFFFQTISHWGEIWWFWDGAAVHYGGFFLDFFFSPC